MTGSLKKQEKVLMNMNNEKTRARVIAFYLPQYHPVDVNDKIWGKGFTEWRNVTSAKPLFRGHYQPHLPADLGFYDLRIPEVREEQAALAREAGVEGFCYWHYWFKEGKEVLERPLDEVVSSKKPDFPFCIGWANHSWRTSTWTRVNADKPANQYIFEQEYPGAEDHRAHFYRLLDAFKDERYIKIEGKLLFVIYDIQGFKGFREFKEQWNQLATENDLPGFYFVSHTETVGHISVKDIKHIDKIVESSIRRAFELGADGVDTVNMRNAEFRAYGSLYKMLASFNRKNLSSLTLEKYDFRRIVKHLVVEQDEENNVFPEIIVGNDRSPRAGRKAIVYHHATPEAFYDGAKKVIDSVQMKDYEHRIIFLNSWNEWGEGMHMEPDLKNGKGFIKALREALK